MPEMTRINGIGGLKSNMRKDVLRDFIPLHLQRTGESLQGTIFVPSGGEAENRPNSHI